MIQVNNLAVYRGKKAILDQVDAEIIPGRKLAVLGPNGAGKSTLLKCISQEIHDYQGDILLEKKALSHWPALERARSLAVMPQKVELTFPFQAYQVVAMGRIPYGDEGQSDDLIREAMLCTDVWHLRQRSYPLLSGGEQQRVQLARVLLQIWQQQASGSEANIQQRYLLLDECTSALDPAHQHAIMSLANQFAQQGVAVLAVMHDVALAASWADDILILKQGKVLASGDADLLAQADILQQAYDLEGVLAGQYARQNAEWLALRSMPSCGKQQPELPA